MNNKDRGEVILSCVFAAVGIAAVVIIQLQVSMSISNSGATTFKTFPTLFGLMLAGLSVINILRIFMALAQKKEKAVKASAEDLAPNSKLIGLRVCLMFVLSLIMALLLKKVYFPVLIFAFLFLAFYILGQKKIWLNALVAAAGSAVVFVIFDVLLKLPL